MSCNCKRLTKKMLIKLDGAFHRIPEEGKPMKRYFLLGCIVAISPIMQSASANAADLGLAPAPSAPYVPRTFNWSRGPSWGGGGGCCCCSSASSAMLLLRRLEQ